MSLRIAINGFGRIGRVTARLLLERNDIELVAVNDLTDTHTLAHLFKYDSVHGMFPGEVGHDPEHLILGGKKIKAYAEKDPSKLPWKALGIDVVIECTGFFLSRELASAHLKAGAKKVILSAPAKDADIKSVVLGVNEHTLDGTETIISNASCTTNCAAPMIMAVKELCGIEDGFITTVHSFTGDQRLHDAPHKDLRRARAAALSMIPTTTGAATAVGEVLPDLKGRLDGFSMRVPTPNVSVVDLSAILNRKTTAEEVNAALRAAAEGPLKGILAMSDDPLVSIDFRGNPNSSIVDSAYTKVMDGDFVKLLSWYDNEWGYSSRCVDLLRLIVKKGL